MLNPSILASADSCPARICAGNSASTTACKPWASIKALTKSGSPVYQKWQEQVLKFRGGVAPDKGAIWFTLYPNIMVEWYPHVLVVSTLWPRGPQKTTNVVEFYYPEEIVLFEREFVEAERAAYMETCVEDDEIALRMDAGRRILLDRGENEVGPYQSPMEDGMQHFHEWYRRQIALTTMSGSAPAPCNHSGCSSPASCSPSWAFA